MSFDVEGTVHIEVLDLTANASLGEVELDRPQNLDQGQVDEQGAEIRQLEVF